MYCEYCRWMVSYGIVSYESVCGQGSNATISYAPVWKCSLAWYPPEVIYILWGGAELDKDDWRWIAGRITLSNQV